MERKYFPSRYPYQPFGDPLERKPGYSPSEARERAKERESSWERQREQEQMEEAERQREAQRAAHRQHEEARKPTEQDERREEERLQRMRERQQREAERRAAERELEGSFDAAPSGPSLKVDAADPRNTFTGKAGPMSKMFATDGRMAGGIGGSKEQHHGVAANSGTLTFNGVKVLCTGLYTVTFHYVTHGDRGAFMRVNGGGYRSFEFKSTGAWNRIRLKAVHNVTLIGECSGNDDGLATCPGTDGNKIKIYNDENWCADLDMIEVGDARMCTRARARARAHTRAPMLIHSHRPLFSLQISVGEGQDFDHDADGDPQKCPPPSKSGKAGVEGGRNQDERDAPVPV